MRFISHSFQIVTEVWMYSILQFTEKYEVHLKVVSDHNQLNEIYLIQNVSNMKPNSLT